MERDLGNVPAYDVDVTDLVRGDGASVRKPRVRAKTISVMRLSKRELERGRELWPPSINDAHERPRTRADCLPGGCNEVRPCPWVSCKHHVAHEVTAVGSIKTLFPDRELDEIPETCALDAADRGGMTLEEVGVAMGVSRERVRQIEDSAIRKLRALADVETLGEDYDLALPPPNAKVFR